jgi:hypothetical protein
MIVSRQGDPVLLPQGSYLLKDLDGWNRVKSLEQPERAILLETHPRESHMRKVYLTCGFWWIDESEIQDLVGARNAYQAY